jgi:hypothetical protein
VYVKSFLYLCYNMFGVDDPKEVVTILKWGPSILHPTYVFLKTHNRDVMESTLSGLSQTQTTTKVQKVSDTTKFFT